MIRLDPAAAVPVLEPVVPAWALANGAVVTDADAAFCAGAALSALETRARKPAGPAPGASGWR
ncbi:hypothetical protein [Mesorhizobium sp. M0520]|uniref:hypothetical protein n=1 Tax=Mesorhizobium sp. M0520 TaxID=2956957 RepID=UPI003334D5F7